MMTATAERSDCGDSSMTEEEASAAVVQAVATMEAGDCGSATADGEDVSSAATTTSSHDRLVDIDEHSEDETIMPSVIGESRRLILAHVLALAAALALFVAATSLHGPSGRGWTGTADQRRRTRRAVVSDDSDDLSATSANDRSLKKRKPHASDPGDDADSSSHQHQKYIPPEEMRHLLDFAIVGFPKTGTSFMEHYLFNQDPELHLDNREHCLGKEDNYDSLTNLVNLYGFEIGATTEDGIKVKNAIKCPHELLGEFNLANYEKYLPEIKFVVSTRHPVSWFQSWYNYKLRQTNKHSKSGEIWAPPTRDLIGACAEGTPYHYGAPNKLAIKEKKNVCTDGAKFHHALSRFGKTPMNTEEELELLDHHEMSAHDMPLSRVFIMELDQFKVDSPEEEKLAEQFLIDMKDYLGLEHDLPPLYHHESKPVREEVEDYVIDICDDEHELVRGELIKAGRDAYLWIRDYFVDSPGVVVSNRDHFLSLVERWQYDPCDSAEE